MISLARHTQGVRILLVEDDEVLAATLQEALVAGMHDVQVVSGGRPALAATDYDLVLLDLELPDLNGREVCRLLRQREPQLPIMIVSGAGDEIDRVLGFELGADDYLVKPFSVRELLARVRAVGKRSGLELRAGPRQRVGDAVLVDRRSRRVFLRGEEVHVTPKEFDVLAYLCDDIGAACRREDILERVWGARWFGPTKTLDAHIASLRRKLAGGVVITALRGVGFRVDPV